MRIKKLLVVGLLCAAFATLCIDMTGCGGSGDGGGGDSADSITLRLASDAPEAQLLQSSTRGSVKKLKREPKEE